MENYRANENIDVTKGLNIKEVEERKKQGKVNTVLTKTSKSFAKIFFTNIFTWFNLICFAIAGVLIAVGSYVNTTFLLIFMSNLLIGLVQEIRAKIMVDKISVMTSNSVRVLRNGKEEQIEIEKIVVDDIVFFQTGDQICCDCVLIDGNIEANESLVTGESKPIKKVVGDTLLGGSFVTSGLCKAMAVKVGLETYSSTLIKKARVLKENQSDILKTLNFIIKTIGFLLVPLGLLTFLDIYKTKDLTYAIIKTSGSIIGMMPVGMFLLTSVSLAVGVLKLAKQKTLVQSLYSIEMLARANVLCLDKTGTLTDGTMFVKSVLPLYNTKQDITKIMQNYLSVFGAKNQTFLALEKYFGTDKTFKNLSKIEFSSDRKFSAASFEEGTFILGAPEFVTTKLDSELKQMIKDFTTDGYRVVLLCKCSQKIKDEKVSKANTPIALITIQDKIRPDAFDTIRWFNENNVEIKIISGDNVDTVSNISKKVGVIGAEKCISLEGMTDEEVTQCALKYNVFGRVTPEQKCLLIKALKGQGKKVAMTGDGVNDILALKEADCSIAMASGSEATRSVSNLVMLENNFSCMPKVVEEGRRVVNNISKASSLFLTKTFFAMFLTIFTLISPTYDYPLESSQILFWETLFIGIPAFFLALQPNNKIIEGSFIASLTSKALPGALVLFLSAMACYIYGINVGYDTVGIATLISYCVTFGAFFILLNLSLPLDKYRAFIVFSLLALCLIAFAIIPKGLFNYILLSTNDYIFIVISLAFICLGYIGLKTLFEMFFNAKLFKKEKRQ